MILSSKIRVTGLFASSGLIPAFAYGFTHYYRGTYLNFGIIDIPYVRIQVLI